MVGSPLPETILELKLGVALAGNLTEDFGPKRQIFRARLGNVAVDDAGDLYTSAVLEAVGNGH